MSTVGYTVAWARGIEFLNSTASAWLPLFTDADNLYARIDLTPAKDLKTGVFGLYQHRNADVNPAVSTATPPLIPTVAAPSHLLRGLARWTTTSGTSASTAPSSSITSS